MVGNTMPMQGNVRMPTGTRIFDVSTFAFCDFGITTY
jgi:hypothetical protein